jgi:hypothetical protein
VTVRVDDVRGVAGFILPGISWTWCSSARIPPAHHLSPTATSGVRQDRGMLGERYARAPCSNASIA